MQYWGQSPITALTSPCGGGVISRDKIRTVEVRRRVEVQDKLSDSEKNCVLRWFGHVYRMDDDRMVKKVYDSGVQGR